MIKTGDTGLLVEKYSHFHLVGICGMGMTSCAVLLKDMGKTITGSDNGSDYPTTPTLQQNGIQAFDSFDPAHVREADCVIYSGANGGSTNPEVQEALRRGIKTVSLARFIGELTKGTQTIAVCGCHGKSTTAALTAYTGNRLGMQVSYYIGAPSFMGQSPGSWKNGTYFSVESDEYVADPVSDRTPKFLYMHPKTIVCTNIDFDHPDVFKDIHAVESSFAQFFHRLPRDGFMVINGDDNRLLDLARKSGNKFYSYGQGMHNDFRIADIKNDGEFLAFSVFHTGRLLGNFKTKLLGEHNVSNATAVIALYTMLAQTPDAIAEALKPFTGVSRRMEFRGRVGEALLYDDYAHHPAEIEASITALKKRFPDSHLSVIFQPHTFSRTEKLQDAFIQSLKHADTAILLPVFASARETSETYTITSEKLVLKASAMKYDNFEHALTDSELSFLVASLVEKYPRHIFLTMGAGDVYTKQSVISSALS